MSIDNQKTFKVLQEKIETTMWEKYSMYYTVKRSRPRTNLPFNSICLTGDGLNISYTFGKEPVFENIEIHAVGKRYSHGYIKAGKLLDIVADLTNILNDFINADTREGE